MYKLVLIISILLFNIPVFSQDSTSSLKWENGIIRGFSSVEKNKIPDDILKNLTGLEKRFKYDKEYEDDTVKFYKNNTSLWGIRFINQSYEMTFVVADNRGKWVETVSCINPEYKDFNQINDSVTEKGYYVESMDSPFGSVYKYQTPTDQWFEATVINEMDADDQAILVFDEHYRLIRTRKVK
jgi:hypothetical protein